MNPLLDFIGDGAAHEPLYFDGAHPPRRMNLGRAASVVGLRDVVPIPALLLYGMRGRHHPAVSIAQQARQKTGLARVAAVPALYPGRLKLSLDAVEQLALNDGIVKARIGLPFVHHVADVDPVLQEHVEWPATDRLLAVWAPPAVDARLAAGMTQEQLAFESRLDLTYIGGIARAGAAIRAFSFWRGLRRLLPPTSRS